MQTDRYCFSWMILQNICSAIFLFLDSQSNIGFLFCGTFYLVGYFTFRDERSRRLGVGETSAHGKSLSRASMACSRQAVDVPGASLSENTNIRRSGFCAGVASKSNAGKMCTRLADVEPVHSITRISRC